MIRVDPFTLFDKHWALLTAGTADHFNTMTISWGMLGTLWNKPAATVYVRESRYTLPFMEDSDWFTISFFDESFKKDLGILGVNILHAVFFKRDRLEEFIESLVDNLDPRLVGVKA